MIRFSKIFLIITIIMLLAWQLPWCYSFFAAKPSYNPFTLYSSLVNDFISIDWEEDSDIFSYDQSGNKYTREETDSLLPFFYIRQLMSDFRVPEEINGIKVNPREIQITNFSFRSSPSDINANKIELYPLLETMSGRVDLEYPEDVFRITNDRIEFIVMNTNDLNEKKSNLFTKTMKNKGFTFPAKCIAGNPTTRKDYDEGYLILDSKGELFHLKQMKGRPFFRHIEKPKEVEFEQLFITEFRDRKTLGLMTDTDKNLYVLNNKTYEIMKTGVENYNPKEDDMTIIGNMLDWTVNISSDKRETYYAINSDDYSLIKSITIDQKNQTFRGLHFTSFKDKFVKPRF